MRDLIQWMEPKNLHNYRHITAYTVLDAVTLAETSNLHCGSACNTIVVGLLNAKRYAQTTQRHACNARGPLRSQIVLHANRW
jgi:hypothetical protein